MFLPVFLVPESLVHGGGTGPVLPILTAAGGTLLVTLGITSVIEQESLLVTVTGSADGSEWLPQPLLTFPQKFYCGVSSLLLDLSKNADVAFLRTEWKTNRWGRGDKEAHFRFYLFLEPVTVTAG